MPNPVGQLGRPEGIAAAVAFLASPLAAYITGTVLRVDGGITPASTLTGPRHVAASRW